MTESACGTCGAGLQIELTGLSGVVSALAGQAPHEGTRTADVASVADRVDG